MHNNMLPESENNLVSPQHTNTTSSSHHHQSTSLLYNLSVLRDKLTQMQTLAGVLVSSSGHGPDQTAIPGDPASCSAIASMNSIIQEFIVTASSMMITCQHMLLNLPPPGTITTTTTTTNDDNNRYCNSNTNNNLNIIAQDRGQSTMFSSNSDDWFAEESFDNNNDHHNSTHHHDHVIKKDDNLAISTNKTTHNNNHGDDSDIIELDAADLLAKYTHYCQICGKGFKRDANLRMHMRAHGDEYKSSAALSNPMKNKRSSGLMMMMNNTEIRPKKYSCPQEGCRWNQRHAKFQPLKSMICVKNHYKRSHCPKMYVCKRCNLKQFSVLSDLRTHEKHCGDLKWQCSCGTTFSRKDKLMGHVALFIGHTPAIITSTSALSYSSLEHC